jgi:hypothetical protein
MLSLLRAAVPGRRVTNVPRVPHPAAFPKAVAGAAV